MIEIKNVGFYYSKSNSNIIFENFNLSIKKGEIVSLVGPSGCGKSTLINLIAGYLKVNEGTIEINNKNVNTPGKDRIVINQADDLFDWMTVEQNMEVATNSSETIKKYLEMTKLSSLQKLFPRQLSGGMKKRLSIARAFATESDCILIDEAFSSLDYLTKEELQSELLEIIHKTKKTVLLVTHDIEEAVFLSDKVVILSDHPVNIKSEIKVDFPYPRKIEIKESVEFVKLKNKIKHIFNQQY